MRVLQLIDSLRPGGAERMSVNYANALAKRIDASFLCCTRIEGLIKSQLSPEVGYLFLNKRRTLDLRAFLQLRNFVKENEISLIHAHGSSWFLALLVKASIQDLKLVWHDHWGERALKNLPPGILKPASRYFNGIISVNQDLEKWAKTNLESSYTNYIPNFIPEKKKANVKTNIASAVLKGRPDSFKIICLANLKPPKDHFTLINSFRLLVMKHPNTSLHLIGEDKQDDYSRDLKRAIKEFGLQNQVFIYGEQGRVDLFLTSADMGVLSSKTEGLPVALLEYGQFSLPVVCTRVGQCEDILSGHGLLVPAKNSKKLSEAISDYISNPVLRADHSNSFHSKVSKIFSEKEVLKKVLTFYYEVEGIR